MKSEEQATQITEASMNDSLYHLFPQEISTHQARCSGRNLAFQYCINEDCHKQTVFTCLVGNCKCHQQHQSCQKASLKFTIKQIQSKIYDCSGIKQLIDKSFQRLIDQLSQFRDCLLIDMEKKYIFSYLDPVQKLFYTKLSQNQMNGLSSQETSQLWKVIKGKKHLQRQELNLMDELGILLNDLGQSINSSVRKLGFNINNLDLRINQIQSINHNLIKQSSILKTKQLTQRFTNLFQGNIKSIKLIFKASDHGFKIQKFYELCGNIKDIAILCQTTKNKIIGGYTPLSFNPTGDNNKYIEDPSLKSMLFSLTQNDKFTLKDKHKNRAIHRNKDKKSFSFGNGEFKIASKSTQQQKNGTAFLSNPYYGNQKYPANKQSYQKWTGFSDQKFSTKQWEAFAIVFKN